MAKEVLAGSTRVGVRSPGAAFAWGFFTSVGSVVYWAKTLNDIARYEKAEHGTTGVRAGAEIVVASIGMFAFFGLQFWQGFQEASAEIDPVTGLPESSSSDAIIGIGYFVLWAVWMYMAWRMRTHMNRVFSRVGMLPEDRPGGTQYWLCCLLGPVVGATVAVSQINKAWAHFPRYYASLGGTKEQVAMRAGVPMSTAAAGLASPPGRPPAEVAAATERAKARMQELAPGAAAGSLTSAQSLEYAEAVEQVHGADQAAQWYQYVSKHDPSNHKASWWYGVYLLDRGDSFGVDVLRRVIGNPTYDKWARERIAAFLERNGRAEEAARYRASVA